MRKTMDFKGWDDLYFDCITQWQQNKDGTPPENAFYGDFKQGQIHSRNIYLDNFSINYTDMRLHQIVRSQTEIDLDLVQMRFSLAGSTDIFSTLNTKLQSDISGMHNILYLGEFKEHYDCLGKYHQFFYVNLKPSYFL